MKLKGISASKGIGIGKVYIHEPQSFTIPNYKIVGVPKEDELNRFFEARKKASQELEIIKQNTFDLLGEDYADIIDAQIEMVNDTSVLKEIKWAINHNHNATFAFNHACNKYIRIFNNMENEYISERASDVEDIRDRVLRHLLNEEKQEKAFKEEVVIIGHDISPSLIVQLDLNFVKAFVTNIGSDIAHNAIIARSLELPGVVNTKEITKYVKDGDTIIVDGDKGYVIVNPSQEEIDFYKRKQVKNSKKKDQLIQYKDKEIFSIQGHKINFLSNITSPLDLRQIKEYGSDGVGLYRSEFLYMEQNHFPSIRRQIESYHKVLSFNPNHKVIIRTLDIGGDKVFSYIRNKEDLKGIQYSLKYPDVFKLQIKALLLANRFGNLHIMLPYVSEVQEVIQAKSLIKEVEEKLTGKLQDYKLGIMIETLESINNLEELVQHIDFISIGTNDLQAQYFNETRQNKKRKILYDNGFLSLIKKVIHITDKHDIPSCICGELATNEDFVKEVLSYGLKELSMNTNMILQMKETIEKL